MNTIIVAPDKAQVREWLRQRRANPEPLPDPAQVRSQLGWCIVAAPSSVAPADTAAKHNMSKGTI